MSDELIEIVWDGGEGSEVVRGFYIYIGGQDPVSLATLYGPIERSLGGEMACLLPPTLFSQYGRFSVYRVSVRLNPDSSGEKIEALLQEVLPQIAASSGLIFWVGDETSSGHPSVLLPGSRGGNVIAIAHPFNEYLSSRRIAGHDSYLDDGQLKRVPPIDYEELD